MKIIIPAAAEVIAATSTKPAETSLASFAFGCSSSVKESIISSIALFASSRESTKPIKVITIIHSMRVIFSKYESKITASAIRMCNLKFGSSLKAIPIPSKAYLKDKILLW